MSDVRTADTALLAGQLRSAVRGAVRFDSATRAMWSADSSNYRHVPLGVVQPVDADDVEAAVDGRRPSACRCCRWGAGTSICGQSVNEAVVIDFHRAHAPRAGHRPGRPHRGRAARARCSTTCATRAARTA